jgi:hypothetical protein
MDLLERSLLLDELSDALATTAAAGHVVLVAGEAGIGKSALVKRFTERHSGEARFLFGACDPLLTPRALGPLHDVGREAGGRLAALLADGMPREHLFAALLDELGQRSRRHVVVVEDAHWADEATLDLLVFLGRRMERTRAARELLRVCRPGGRIGMVNWIPGSYVGELFRTIGRYVPPPPGLQAPVLWGSPDRLRELFGPDATISSPQRTFRWRFPSPEHQVEFFTTFYGPANRAVATLPADRAAGLKAEMLDVVKRFNVSNDNTLMLRMDYLEAVIHKPATP